MRERDIGAPPAPVVYISRMDFEQLRARGRQTLTAYVEPVGTSSNEVALYAAPVAAAPAPVEVQRQPFGHVAVYDAPDGNHAPRYQFSPFGQSPYLDNATACYTVYLREPVAAAPAPQRDVWAAARQAVADMPRMDYEALSAIDWPSAVSPAKERLAYARNVEQAVRAQLSTAAAQALTAAPAPQPSEERCQLRHLLDDIVEEAGQDGATYYRIRDGKDLLFSNLVGACARLLAQPEGPAPQPLTPLTDEQIIGSMTRRDAFVAAALAGGLGQGIQADVREQSGHRWWIPPEQIAERAAAIADAVLALDQQGAAT